MKHDIQGINPGAGTTRFSIKMMGEYGLNAAGYRFHHRNYDKSSHSSFRMILVIY